MTNEDNCLYVYYFMTISLLNSFIGTTVDWEVSLQVSSPGPGSSVPTGTFFMNNSSKTSIYFPSLLINVNWWSILYHLISEERLLHKRRN